MLYVALLDTVMTWYGYGDYTRNSTLSVEYLDSGSTEKRVRPPRIELTETVRACGSLRSPVRAVTRLLNSGQLSLTDTNRSLSLTVAEVQSALPELNGGQADLQSAALPG